MNHRLVIGDMPLSLLPGARCRGSRRLRHATQDVEAIHTVFC